MIHSIYPLNKILWGSCRGPEYHISKCLEELGEIQEAYVIYLSKNRDNQSAIIQIHEEICDLFAWVLSAWRLSCLIQEFSMA